MRTITGVFVLFGKLQFVIAYRMGVFVLNEGLGAGVEDLWSRSAVVLAQVGRNAGAGVRVCWRRCAFWV